MDRDQITRELLHQFSEKLVSSVLNDDYSVVVNREKIVTDISTDDNGVNTGLGWTFTDVPASTINVSRIIPRVNDYYIPLRDHLNANYTTKYGADIMLLYYSQRIVENGFTDEEVVNFLNDLTQVDPNWINQVKFRGLVVTELIQAGPFTFRKVELNDLSETISPFGDKNPRMRVPHSILEYKSIEMSPQDNARSMLNLIETLRFYRPSAISHESYTNQTNSLNYIEHGGTPRIAIDLPYQPTLFLTQSDGDFLPTFIEFMEPKIDLIRHQEKENPIKIAYQRYTDSLMSLNPSVESKLTSSIMGLEALFLIGNYELSFKLRLFIAKLLSYLNENPNDVIVNVKKAYECRSKYIHGSVLRDKDKNQAQQLLDKSRNYLRKALIYFMYYNIKSQKSKQGFIQELEQALIDESQSSLLKEKATLVLERLPGIF